MVVCLCVAFWWTGNQSRVLEAWQLNLKCITDDFVKRKSEVSTCNVSWTFILTLAQKTTLSLTLYSLSYSAIKYDFTWGGAHTTDLVSQLLVCFVSIRHIWLFLLFSSCNFSPAAEVTLAYVGLMLTVRLKCLSPALCWLICFKSVYKNVNMQTEERQAAVLNSILAYFVSILCLICCEGQGPFDHLYGADSFLYGTRVGFWK